MTNKLIKWGGVAALVMTGPVLASDSGEAELREQVAELKAKVQQLEGRATTHSRDLADAIDSVLRDADKRSHLLAAGGGLNAGYDNGFFIRSDDGNFLLKPAINAQFRNVTSFRQNAKADGDDDTQNGFDWRRLRFRFDGNAFSKDLTFSFVWDTNRSGGAVALLDAWAQYQFDSNWAVKLGQFKASVFQERNLSGFAQLAVDRSLADALIAGANIDRVQGIAGIYGGGGENPLRVELAFHDGANSRNTNFQDTFDSSSPPDGIDDRADWGVAGRVEFKPFGDWKNYKDFSAAGNTKDLLVIGAAGNVDGAPGANIYWGTVDAQWEVGGKLSVFGALFARHRDRREAEELTDYGGLMQAGYLIAPAWELFARYDVTKLDEDSVADGTEDTFNEITAGVNYFLGKDGSYRHRAKISVDLTYLPDGSPSSQDSLGILSSEDDEWVLRAQVQLLL
jgi:hypothetical protein